MSRAMPLSQKVPFAKLSRLLKGYDLCGKDIAEMLGCSAPTGRNRLDNPENFTLGELYTICRKSGIPAEEIREAAVR